MSYKKLKAIYNGTEPTDYAIFYRLEHSLNLDISEALGKPRFNSNNMEYWLGEKREHKISPSIPGITPLAESYLHFTLLAIRELNAPMREKALERYRRAVTA